MLTSLISKFKGTASGQNASYSDLITASKWQNTKFTADKAFASYTGWVYACSKLIAESVSSVPYRVFVPVKGNSNVKNYTTKQMDLITTNYIKKSTSLRNFDSYVELLDHPIIDFLEEVNGYSNYHDHLFITQIHLELLGAAYWYVVKEKDGLPAAMYILRPDLMKVVVKDDQITGYVYGEDTNKVAFTPDEIIRFINPSPKTPFYGQSTLEAAINESERLGLYNIYENSNLKNNARPDFAVKYKGGRLDKASMSQLYKEWNGIMQGPQNANKVKIMDGDFDIVTLGFSAKDMEFLQGRYRTIKDVCAIFGVPVAMIDTSDQLKAGIDEVQQIFLKYTIAPKLKRIADTLNEFLCPVYDQKLYFVYDKVDKTEEDMERKTAMELFGAGIITLDEARVRCGIAVN